MIDLQTLTKIANTQEIDTNTIYREYVQIRFLQEIYHTVTPGSIYFKGGTALRLIFGSERFSEDLDFTIPGNKIKANMVVRESVKRLTQEFPDIYCKDVKTIIGYCSKLYLHGINSTFPLTIKLDFSMREHIIEPQTSPLQHTSLATDIVLVEHISKSEILAEKFRAVSSRKKGRDLYDIWYLLHSDTVLSIHLINQKLAYYHEHFDLDNIIESVHSYNEKELYDDLARFLPKSKRKIIQELKRLVLDILKSKISDNISNSTL